MPPCAWSGSAVAYLMNTLAPRDFADFGEHIERECPFCSEELEEARVGLAHLDAETLWQETPTEELPARVLEQVRAGLTARVATKEDDIQTWKQWTSRDDESDPALTVLHADEGEWEPIGIPGITVKRLAVDAVRECVTMLVRMKPGSAYPPHRHAAHEECYVVDGDLRVGEEILMRSGDYQRAPAGSRHAVQSTEGGCTLLITSSQHDELAL